MNSTGIKQRVSFQPPIFQNKSVKGGYMISKVIRVIKDRGFGFVNHKGEDLFFHRNGFNDPRDYDVLEPGDLIDYEIGERSPDNMQAIDIIFAKAGGGK